ncbi:MAG: hemerythrin domain-containing protein [Betaproteobacteria bacterium]
MLIQSKLVTENPPFAVEIAVGHICSEHRRIIRVLEALAAHGRDVAAGACAADLRLIDAMLSYFEMFSSRIHDEAEEKYLLPGMREHGAPDSVVDCAIGAHRAGRQRLTALRDIFRVWQDQPAVAAPAFLAQLPDHFAVETLSFSFEENVVLPCAFETLPTGSWTLIADAFGMHEDPLFGTRPAPALAPLQRCLFGPASSQVN